MQLHEGRAPRMQDGVESQPRPLQPMLPHIQQRFGGGLEQDVVNQHIVVLGQVGQLAGDRKDQVMIRHRQDFLTTRGIPLPAFVSGALRTVPIPARVPGVLLVSTVIALEPMSAQRRRATGFDLAQRAVPLLVTLENRRADLAVEPGVQAKDGGDFEFPAPRAPLLPSPFDAAVTRWPWRITRSCFRPSRHRLPLLARARDAAPPDAGLRAGAAWLVSWRGRCTSVSFTIEVRRGYPNHCTRTKCMPWGPGSLKSSSFSGMPRRWAGCRNRP